MLTLTGLHNAPNSEICYLGLSRQSTKKCKGISEKCAIPQLDIGDNTENSVGRSPHFQNLAITLIDITQATCNRTIQNITAHPTTLHTSY